MKVRGEAMREKIIEVILSKINYIFDNLGILMIVFVLSTSILFLPNKYIETLSLDFFVENFSHIFGILFMISFLGLLRILILNLKEKIIKLHFNYKRKKYLENLSPEEKLILGSYIFSKQKTRYFSAGNGKVIHLIKIGFLYESAEVSARLLKFAFTMNNFTWNYLNKNKDLIRISEEDEEILKKRGLM